MTLEQKMVDTLSTVPFLSVAGVNFMTLNEFLETGTLILGFVAGLFAVFFHARRWYLGRKTKK